MRSFQTSVPDACMRYLEFEGQGIPLLMIHGLGCASSFEYPHVATSPALHDRHTILLDLLGFGFSDHPEEFGYRVEDHAFEISRFVEELGLEQLDIYGHSMGGSIAIETADLLANKVRRLILSEANLDSGGGEFSSPIASSAQVDYFENGHLRTCEAAAAAGDAEWSATMRVASPRAVYHGAKSLVEGSKDRVPARGVAGFHSHR